MTVVVLERRQAEAALVDTCWCGVARDDHSVPCPDVPFPAAMLMYPHLRQSTLGEFFQCALLRRFKMLHEQRWHSQPQTRGSHFHRWAAELLRTLEILHQDKLRDEPECPNDRCQARPNDLLEAAADGTLVNTQTGEVVAKPYEEGQLCPICGEESLEGVALEDLAIDILMEVLRQRDVPDDDRLPLPYGEHLKDLEWVVRKFAREQTFNIGRLVDVEERLAAPIYYPSPLGGVVKREFSGQMDAVFWGHDQSHVVVLDWKDTWAIPGPQALSPEGYFQQRAYAWLIMSQPGNEHIDTVTLREVYVRFGAGDSGEENHRTATITRARLPMIGKELALIAEAFDEAVQHGELRPILWENPSPGGHCNYCPLPHKCPAWASYDELKDAGPIQTPEEGEEVAALLVVAKRVAKLMEGRLKGYLGKSAARRPSTPVRVPTGTTGKGGDPDALTVFKDRPPSLPEGVPIKTAKGQKVFAYVEGKRTDKPDEQQVQEALEARSKGIPVDASDLFRTGSTTTFRLVELTVPTDGEVDARLASVASEGAGR